jgi:hypothetical protein
VGEAAAVLCGCLANQLLGKRLQNEVHVRKHREGLAADLLLGCLVNEVLGKLLQSENNCCLNGCAYTDDGHA